MTRVRVYSIFERSWHWLQALAIFFLLITGAEIHAPERLRLFGFPTATRVHEALALFTIANAFLSLFYHIATGALRQFIPRPTNFFSLAFAQIEYYTRGIFTGAPHPFVHSEDGKLNVLQQMTYLVVLNILLPVQVATGILMWKAHDWAPLVTHLGGLPVVAAIHVACAWGFAAFIVMHVYLTTTGRTPTSHMRAMVLGWDLKHEAKQEVEHETK
jgi:thiosulfate reductase cytochrome b subunit